MSAGGSSASESNDGGSGSRSIAGIKKKTKRSMSDQYDHQVAGAKMPGLPTITSIESLGDDEVVAGMAGLTIGDP